MRIRAVAAQPAHFGGNDRRGVSGRAIGDEFSLLVDLAWAFHRVADRSVRLQRLAEFVKQRVENCTDSPGLINDSAGVTCTWSGPGCSEIGASVGSVGRAAEATLASALPTQYMNEVDGT